MPKRPSNRGNTGRTITPPTPGREIQRHLRELGLESVHAYQAWCRENGFRAGLDKNWHERREETRHAQRAAEEAALNGARRRHLEALGLKSEEQYAAWCASRGFSGGGKKSREQLRQERLTVEREQAQAALAGSRRHQRRVEDIIAALYRGEEVGMLKTPYLLQVQAVFQWAEAPAVREALLRLLLHTHRHANLASAEPVVPHLGPQPGNTFSDALLALARRHAQWLQGPESWRPDTRNARRQFHSLACHLLARYPIPPFMAAAWFEGSLKAVSYRDWFLHIGTGKNIRTADIPLHLTRMSAHHFLEAPADLPIPAALRWGQVLGLGGDVYLARTVIGSRLGGMMKDEPFWVSFLHFLINNPMLDPACVGPMVDYIHHVRYDAREIVGEDGTVEVGPPLEPEFTMKGRTVPALWRRVEAWHRELAKEVRKPPVEWEPAGIGGLDLEEADPASGRRFHWTIRELHTSRDLTEEGREMRHCVASYARSCAKGHTAIFSMQVEEAGGRHRRVMTIEVQTARRIILQARGRCNKRPGTRHAPVLLDRAPEILKQWARQERLALPAYV